MFGREVRELPERIGFFLVPNFSMIAFTAAVEPLRIANRAAGRELYSWSVVSKSGGPVAASNGVAVTAQMSIADVDRAGRPGLPTLVLCSGIGAEHYADREVFAWLRRLDRQGADIGAVCTGALVLARAGLLDDHVCTVHWENLPGFMEAFPDIEVTDDLFEIDRNRFTCSGGTAALDMMLHLIRLQHGSELATQVSEQCIMDHIRDSSAHQRQPVGQRLHVHNPKLVRVIELMEANLEEPLAQDDLARHAGLSRRQVQRLFLRHLGRPPAKYYLELRLDRARHLLYQTDMPIIDVALACGFVSASHFSKCYRQMFGRTPRDERRFVA